MQVRLTKVDEFQLLTCLKRGLWGSRSARFRQWLVGDKLIVLSGKAVAALAEVTGEPFVAKDRVWDNGLFPHRIPIKFTHVLLPENRPPILGDIRNALTAAWGPHYGIGILNQNLLPENAAEVLIREIKNHGNDLAEIIRNFDVLMAAAKQARDNSHRKKVNVPEPANRKKIEDDEPLTKAEESIHSKAQDLLVRLGRVTGCNVWVAANDRGRVHNGHRLGEGCLEALPNLGLDPQAAKRMSLIDVIWVRQNSPVCAFEVETTTSVHSGLLRMSDLLASVPVLKMNLFIVAPRARQQKYMSEISRPTFQKIGLNEFCRFVAVEDLEQLFNRVKDLDGCLNPEVLDKIALEIEEVANVM